MRIIGKAAITEFSETHHDALEPLLHWHGITKRAVWRRLADVRADFPHADAVGAFTVFDVRGKFRGTWVCFFRVEHSLQIFFTDKQALNFHGNFDLLRLIGNSQVNERPTINGILALHLNVALPPEELHTNDVTIHLVIALDVAACIDLIEILKPKPVLLAA